MTKLAIQGLIAITSALWLPAQADLARTVWGGDQAGEARSVNDDVAENSPTLFVPGPDRDRRD
ncbi:hypothetical protein LL252_01890 [Alcanivorax marinus]|uniref:Uncharacterized protein n=1 Tax=Alloalcanivorax marinus TaxID=1177169 RepID=A0A9Q3UJE2_9GAMM|nr:hypothetical protein [Alloalcanivorax marinus]MCC4307310.1 hypothetical protein [Alloalcanivorax marinus]